MEQQIQRSFAGGELAPTVQARADQEKYASGADIMENFQIMRHGGATTRQGLGYVATVKNSNVYARLLKFVFNDDQTYVLEVGYDATYAGGDGAVIGSAYMRVYQDGGQLVVSASDYADWANATPYVVGQLVQFPAASGNIYYCQIAHTSTLALEPTDTAGVPYWYKLTGFVYEMPMPYAAADIEFLYTKQSLDVVWFTCRNTQTLTDYAPYELRRTGNVRWTFTLMQFLPPINGPTLDTIIVAAGTSTVRYLVTAIQKGSLQESLPGAQAPTGTNKTITTVSSTGVVIDHGGAHGLEIGDFVRISNVTTLTGSPNALLKLILQNGVFRVTPTTANTFTLDGTEGIVYTNNSHACDWAKAFLKNTAARLPPSQANQIVVRWVGDPSVHEYNVYRVVNGIPGFVGSSIQGSSLVPGDVIFFDTGFEPDLSISPPLYNPTFLIPNKRPGVVGLFQQRLFFGSSNNSPQTVWASQTGNLNNFTTHSPLQDSDALEANISAEQANDVRHMIGISQMFVMTRGQKLLARGDENGTLSAVSGLNLAPQAYGGVSTVPPVLVQENVLYIQARGLIVRDTREEVEGFRGRDLTMYSSHMFEPSCGCELVEWDYAEIPDSVIWAVRADGTMLGLTYVREHNIWGWHRHISTNGQFTSITVVPEFGLDVTYVIMDRTINGADVRYVERMMPKCGGCE